MHCKSDKANQRATSTIGSKILQANVLKIKQSTPKTPISNREPSPISQCTANQQSKPKSRISNRELNVASQCNENLTKYQKNRISNRELKLARQCTEHESKQMKKHLVGWVEKYDELQSLNLLLIKMTARQHERRVF